MPVVGAIVAACGVYYWGPKTYDRVRKLFLHPHLSPVEYVVQYFGINEHGDPLQSFKYLDAKQYCHHSLDRANKHGDMDKFLYFDRQVQDLRPYFTAIDHSDREWTFNNVSPVSLPIWLRLALLPDFAGINEGKLRYWRLVPFACVMAHGHGEESYFRNKSWKFAYQSLYRGPDPEDFAKVYPRIRWLLNGQRLMFTMDPEGWLFVLPWDGVRPEGQVFEWVPPPTAKPPEPELVELPYEPLPFVQEPAPVGQLHDGYLYFGEPFLDPKRSGHWLKIDDMTHFLVVGTSGFGKSVFLNQILQGVRYNIRRFERVLLVDLKGGVELWKYQQLGPQYQVVYRFDDLPVLMADLVAMCEARFEEMRANGWANWPGPKTLLVIDEYAQIQLSSELTKEDRERKRELLANLNKISTLGRAAGVLIWAQLQKGTADVMDSSFRGNLASQVCFKVPNKLTAAGMFGSTDELLVDPVKLPRGRFILYDASEGETHYLQARVQV